MGGAGRVALHNGGQGEEDKALPPLPCGSIRRRISNAHEVRGVWEGGVPGMGGGRQGDLQLPQRDCAHPPDPHAPRRLRGRLRQIKSRWEGQIQA